MTRKKHVFVDGIECKECSECKRVLPLSEYSRSSKAADGLQHICKGCSHERNALRTEMEREMREAVKREMEERRRKQPKPHPVFNGTGEETCQHCKSFSRCSVGGFCLRWKQSVKVGNVCEAYNPDVVKEYKQEAKPVRVGRCTPYD